MLLKVAISVSVFLTVCSFPVKYFPTSIPRKCSHVNLHLAASRDPTTDSPTAKVYKPKPGYKKGPGENGGGRQDSFVLLGKPQLLIRYRVPRVKSELKIELESLQETYRSTGQQGRGGYDSYGSEGSFLDNFPKKEKPGGGPVFSADLKPMRGGKADYKNKDRSSQRPKGSASEKGNRREIDDDDDYDDSDEEDYGDDGPNDLSIVPPSSLRNMEAEGFSLEDIQLSIYGEYGIKATIRQISNKMRDDRRKKFKGRTGKTKRDKYKARIARKNGPDVNLVALPEGPVQIVKLAELLDISGGDIVKHLMLNMGIMTSMTSNVENGVAKDIVQAFGGVLDEFEGDDDSS